ncbi:MAG: error-prone DNA polymerase [Gammaproteobacteria bacterium]|nr:error-prone DNA polymerase [Gammaproteobacteria bacterium]
MCYAELHCISNFTFLRGASHPEELIAQAAELGYKALAITDECSLAGVVRAHIAAKEYGLALVVGAEFRLQDSMRFVLLATDRRSYGQLSELITIARRNADKGTYQLDRQTLASHCPFGCLALWLPDADVDETALLWLAGLFPQRIWIAVELLLTGQERKRLNRLQSLGEKHRIPLCAAGDVHMHVRRRRVLQDTLTAIRRGKPLSTLGYALHPNGERHLRSLPRLEKIYPKSLLQETLRIAGQCTFSLDELRYEYPHELVPKDHTPQSWLRRLTEQGMHRRWPQGVPDKVRRLVEHELVLVRELNYEHYFLTVHDIVRYARSQNILCQGRGSAANSAICYCLGITEVDPDRMQLLFERFISKERNEPPDIDVDFEHERREEVIQYIYRKYGRDRAALAATVITYQPKSAVRDAGKALGMSLDQVDRLAKSIYWWHKTDIAEDELRANGFSPDNPLIKKLLYLVGQLIGFPRHLSQHVGGFVISESKLSQLVPVENAAMADRTVIQWEKDDLEALGLLKVDVLALGMLSAIRKALAYISDYTHTPCSLADIPAEDPEVYAMIQQADTIGVFQIESRAQMSMLPRLRPANYYDLVIQIAIIRPGPIQGDMVHPYLARRNGKEVESYPNDAVRQVLQRTLGVPIFQEQVMQLAMVAAGFSAGEADQLRRAMAAWKRKGGLEKFEDKLLNGMKARGYAEAFAQQIFRQIKGFGEYGFPESHSASFALLAYASSWLKRYHPAAFVCALLNSQPMGFYAPAQLVRDAQRHGVKVLPVDVNRSEHDCTLEYIESAEAALALRLGLRMVKGLSEPGIAALCDARRHQAFSDVQDLASRAKLNKSDMQSLAAADALKRLSGDRHQAFWQVAGTENGLALFPSPDFHETDVLLQKTSEGQDIVSDYAALGLSVGRHPLELLRVRLANYKISTSLQLWDMPNGAFAKAAGLVICRQRPGSANNVMFVTLEDELGHTNVVVWPNVAEQQKKALLKARLLAVTGTVQQEDGVLHLIAKKLEDLSAWLGQLDARSRDFQ